MIALEVTRRELLRMGLRVRTMLAIAVPAALAGTRQDLLDVSALDDEVDALHAEIVRYLGELSRSNLDHDQRLELLRLLQVNNELELLADTIEGAIVGPGLERLDETIEVSETTGSQISALHRQVVDTLDDALEAVGTGDPKAAARATGSKGDFVELAGSTGDYLADRLSAPEPRRVLAYSIEIELLDGLSQAHRSCRRIARAARRSEA